MTGANQVQGEVDPVKDFEKKLLKADILKAKDAQKIWEDFEAEGVKATELARSEPVPKPESVWDHTYFENENADWRNF